MEECICNNCKNLKGIIDETGAINQFECEHGFPSENCSDCEDETICEITCDFYINEDEVSQPVTLKCMTCGKELKQVCSNSEEGNVQCIECFLKQE